MLDRVGSFFIGGKEMKQSVNVILASGSPRRKEMFERMGISFSVMKSNAEEVITKTVPEEVVVELATQKACEIRERLMKENDGSIQEDTLIIGADTIVVAEGKILGKPKDEEDALRILMSLSGKTHSVFTGVAALYINKDGIQMEETSFCFAEETKVIMYPFMEEEAKAYIGTKEPMDKAGAYGIQGIGGIFVKEIVGDYNNVVGFPLSGFMRLACQKNLFRL